MYCGKRMAVCGKMERTDEEKVEAPSGHYPAVHLKGFEKKKTDKSVRTVCSSARIHTEKNL
jgi:hypothetical protein